MLSSLVIWYDGGMENKEEKVGTSIFRTLSNEELRKLNHTLIVQTRGGGNLAAIMPYDQYMLMQKAAVAVGSNKS